MTTARVQYLLAGMLLAAFTGACAQPPGAMQRADASTPEIRVVDTVTATAKVIAIDRADRTVTVQAEGGAPMTLVAGPEVQNFDQIAPGDQVTTEFVRATAVSLRKPGEPAVAGEVFSVERAPIGEKPGTRITRQIEMTAKIEDIDYTERSVVLRDPAGELQTMTVDSRVKNLESFRRGDDVVIRRTEAMRINMTK